MAIANLLTVLGKMVNWFYYVAKTILWILVLLLTRWHVKGRENVPRQGPLLVVVNHLHLADPPIVGLSLGRKAIFMAKEELFRSRFTAYFIRGFGAFPVYRGQLDRKALREAERVLDEGLALVMFPEATRSKNAQLQRAFSGSALVALRSSVPVLPVGITGTEKMKGATWWLRRPRLQVNIGHPFSLPPVNGKLKKAELAELTNLLMQRIAELLPPEYKGSYNKTRELNGIKG